MQNQTCFTPDELVEYALGKLDDERYQTIEFHLSGCAACEETLASLSDITDTLVKQLKTPHRQSQYASDDALQSALRSLRSLPDAGGKNGERDYLNGTHVPGDVDSSYDGPLLRDYRLTELLGQGGMGTVYKAVHTRLDMPVAVKVLPARRMRDTGAVARFQREVRAIGQLDHPSIVRATDAGDVDGTHFLAMELVDGIDLARLSRRMGPLRLADACELIRQAATGIHHAHEQGIIHRDIKPSNLMLTGGGNVKILDLGLSLLSGAHGTVDELTTVGQLMGTLDYMAPEQCDDSHDVGPVVDVYALGATLYKLITSHSPYSGPKLISPLQKLKALATTPVPPISERGVDVPGELADIIARAVSRDPSARFATALEFAESLEPWCRESDLIAVHDSAMQAAATSDDPSASVWASWQALTGQSRLDEIKPPTTEPHAAAGMESNWRMGRWFRIALSLLALTGLAWAAFAIYVETGKGSLMIECDHRDIAVTILRNDKFYDRLQLEPGDNTTSIRAGNYEIRLDGKHDGLKVENGQFTLMRNGKQVAKVVADDAATKVVDSRPPAGGEDVAQSIAEYEAKLLALQTRNVELQHLGPQHPKLKAIEQQMADLTLTIGQLRQQQASRGAQMNQQNVRSGSITGGNAPPKQRLRYDGRTFEEWADQVRFERSPVVQKTAIKAFTELARAEDRRAEGVGLIASSISATPVAPNNQMNMDYPEGTWEAVTQAFSELGHEAVQEAVAKWLPNGDSSTRYNLLKYFYVSSSSPVGFGGRLGLKFPADEALIAAAADTNPHVASYAIALLTMSRDSLNANDARRLVVLLRNTNAHIAAGAAAVLIYRGSHAVDATSTLERILRGGEGAEAKRTAVYYIGYLGETADALVPVLTELVGSEAIWLYEPEDRIALPVLNALQQTAQRLVNAQRADLAQSAIPNVNVAHVGVFSRGVFGQGGWAVPILATPKTTVLMTLAQLGPEATRAVPAIRGETERIDNALMPQDRIQIPNYQEYQDTAKFVVVDVLARITDEMQTDVDEEAPAVEEDPDVAQDSNF